MTYKVVSTLILTGRNEECKCEIYQYDTEEGPRFNACIYIRRNVLMMIKKTPVDLSRSGAPDSKPMPTWIQVRVLKDINDTSLESAETTIKERYKNEAFFIPTTIDSASFF